MARGPCVSWASWGPHAPAGRSGALLGTLCLLPVLALLARLGAPATWPSASAAQVSLPLPAHRCESACPQAPVSGGFGAGDSLWLRFHPLRPGLSLVTLLLSGCKSDTRQLEVENQKTQKNQKWKSAPPPVSFQSGLLVFATGAAPLPPQSPCFP